jgi:hypothetical protein
VSELADKDILNVLVHYTVCNKLSIPVFQSLLELSPVKWGSLHSSFATSFFLGYPVYDINVAQSLKTGCVKCTRSCRPLSSIVDKIVVIDVNV